MKSVIHKLQKIENKHAVFFNKSGKKIIDYITDGIFGSGIFINTDLPFEIVKEIREVFDSIPSVQDQNTGNQI
jgi:hypothetical protein